MGEGGGGIKEFLSFSSLPFSLASSPFPPETPDTQATSFCTQNLHLNFKENVVATSFKICTCSAFLYISETT